MSESSSRPASASPAPPPVLQVTRYDLATASLIAVALTLVLSVVGLVSVWYALRPDRAPADVPLELIEIPGGEEDGAVGETLRLDSPEPVREDPALADATADESQIEKTLETVLALADEATQQTDEQLQDDARSSGRAGSASGTGRRALGRGPGERGLPREQRWFVSFSEFATVDVYARQLANFQIELGALFPDGRLVYLSNLTNAMPTTRTVQNGAEESRLYFTWQGGGRRVADMQLFQRAGVDTANALIFHFYPPQDEAQLAALEKAYRSIATDNIRRTYFAVQRAKGGEGYEFVVTRQTTFR